MACFDENTHLEELPISVYTELVNALDRDAAWSTLANHVAQELEYPCTSWIQYLRENTHLNDSPGQKLFSELSIKMCTVEILRILLSDCKLYNILSIISDPEPLNIVIDPTDEFNNDILKIPFGNSLHLKCKAVGMPPPNYIWYHRNKELQHCTSSELDIIITSASQGGDYKCKIYQIKNDGTLVSTLMSKTVTVQVCSIPIKIEKQPQPILEVKKGESFMLCCEANGYPEPCYQWFHDNTKLEGKTSNTLHIKRFSSEHKGKYYCYIYNDVNEKYTQRTHVMMAQPRLKAVAKVALIIANDEYEHHHHLLKPKYDAAHIGNILKEIGFEVICLINLTITQMEKAIEIFSKVLIEGVYGLFYFAGHGFKLQENYMLPIDAPEAYLRKDAICESKLLSELLENDPKLLIIVLDMCQTLPSEESNPEIFLEVPKVYKHKSKKNSRNLIQAYSTSSYRPCYEKQENKYGLYMTHLSKYINRDITVTELFMEVQTSIDSCFKGKQRNQMPNYTLSVTKPFRLTDPIYERSHSDPTDYLNKLTSFPRETININFNSVNISCRATLSLFMEPYLNIIKIKIHDLPNAEITFFNLVRKERNNLYQEKHKNECWIHNPKISNINEEALVVSLLRNGKTVDVTLLCIKNYVPPLLKLINV